MLTTSLASVGLLAVASAEPDRRDHRDDKDKGDKDRRPPPRDIGPREAPPPARVERAPGVRAGFVFVAGNWDWKNGKWDWTAGHWERERAGKKWRDHRWEKRGEVFVRIDGDWIDAGPVAVAAYPTAGPPNPPRDAIVNPGPGQIWIPGFYEWKNGQYQWHSGFLDKARPGFRFNPHAWEHKGDRWVLNEGTWINDGPTSAPPPLRVERQVVRRGFVFAPGHWDWKNGKWEWQTGHWETERAGSQWAPAHWEEHDHRWEFSRGEWKVVAAYPTAGPPNPPRDAIVNPGPGQVWVPGFYEWKNGQYQWHSGFLDKARPGFRFNPHAWEHKGDRWVLNEGTWVSDGPSSAPPAIRVESHPARVGFVFLPGRWDWKNGKWEWLEGRWEKERPKQRFNPGRWENHNGKWELIEGTWGAEVTVVVPTPPTYPPTGHGPSAPPPAPRAEKYEPKSGFIWAKGHYEWKNNAYEWVDGHWERERVKKTWVDAHWDLHDKVWTFTPGGWQ